MEGHRSRNEGKGIDHCVAFPCTPVMLVDSTSSRPAQCLISAMCRSFRLVQCTIVQLCNVQLCNVQVIPPRLTPPPPPVCLLWPRKVRSKGMLVTDH